jgi:hypothetical protein
MDCRIWIWVRIRTGLSAALIRKGGGGSVALSLCPFVMETPAQAGDGLPSLAMILSHSQRRRRRRCRCDMICRSQCHLACPDFIRASSSRPGVYIPFQGGVLPSSRDSKFLTSPALRKVLEAPICVLVYPTIPKPH